MEQRAKGDTKGRIQFGSNFVGHSCNIEYL